MATNRNPNENDNAAATQAPAATEPAAATQAPAAEPVKDDRVDIFVPRGYANDEPNMVIAVNGVTYLLPKGKTSKVPKHIAAEFYRAQKAQSALDERVDAMVAQAQK